MKFVLNRDLVIEQNGKNVKVKAGSMLRVVKENMEGLEYEMELSDIVEAECEKRNLEGYDGGPQPLYDAECAAIEKRHASQPLDVLIYFSNIAYNGSTGVSGLDELIYLIDSIQNDDGTNQKILTDLNVFYNAASKLLGKRIEPVIGREPDDTAAALFEFLTGQSGGAYEKFSSPLGESRRKSGRVVKESAFDRVLKGIKPKVK